MYTSCSELNFHVRAQLNSSGQATFILRARLREHNEECPKSVSYPGYVVYSIYGSAEYLTTTTQSGCG